MKSAFSVADRGHLPTTSKTHHILTDPHIPLSPIDPTFGSGSALHVAVLCVSLRTGASLTLSHRLPTLYCEPWLVR